MANNLYGMLLPDYGDLDNDTRERPGYRVYVVEKDGGVGLEMIHASEDPVTAEGSAVFMNVQEAREFMQAIQNAINIAEPKKAKHKARGKAC